MEEPGEKRLEQGRGKTIRTTLSAGSFSKSRLQQERRLTKGLITRTIYLDVNYRDVNQQHEMA